MKPGKECKEVSFREAYLESVVIFRLSFYQAFAMRHDNIKLKSEIPHQSE